MSCEIFSGPNDNGRQKMIRLALIGQAKAAKSYGAIRTRLHRAAWSSFVPLTTSDGQAGQALGQVTTAPSTEVLFTEQANDFDAVVIDADPGQAAVLAKASAAGKPSLAGPLLPNIAAISQAHTMLMPAHTWRFLPSIQTVKRSLDAGKLGAPGLLRIHRWLPPKATPESLTERILPDADLACWIFGGAPEKVWTLQTPSNPDYIQFHLGFANGGMAMIDIACSLPAGGDYFSLSIIGATGTAYADDHHNMNLLYAGDQPNALRTSEGRADLAGQLQEFVDAIQEQRQATVTLKDATRAIAVTKQIIESANSNHVIEQKGDS